jgi:hypothetical protein
VVLQPSRLKQNLVLRFEKEKGLNRDSEQSHVPITMVAQNLDGENEENSFFFHVVLLSYGCSIEPTVTEPPQKLGVCRLKINRGILDEARMHKHTYKAYKIRIKVNKIKLLQLCLEITR